MSDQSSDLIAELRWLVEQAQKDNLLTEEDNAIGNEAEYLATRQRMAAIGQRIEQELTRLNTAVTHEVEALDGMIEDVIKGDDEHAALRAQLVEAHARIHALEADLQAKERWVVVEYRYEDYQVLGVYATAEAARAAWPWESVLMKDRERQRFSKREWSGPDNEGHYWLTIDGNGWCLSATKFPVTA